MRRLAARRNRAPPRRQTACPGVARRHISADAAGSAALFGQACLAGFVPAVRFVARHGDVSLQGLVYERSPRGYSWTRWTPQQIVRTAQDMRLIRLLFAFGAVYLGAYGPGSPPWFDPNWAHDVDSSRLFAVLAGRTPAAQLPELFQRCARELLLTFRCGVVRRIILRLTRQLAPEQWRAVLDVLRRQPRTHGSARIGPCSTVRWAFKRFLAPADRAQEMAKVACSVFTNLFDEAREKDACGLPSVADAARYADWLLDCFATAGFARAPPGTERALAALAVLAPGHARLAEFVRR